MNLCYTKESQIISAEQMIEPKEDQVAIHSINGLGKGYWQRLKPQGERLLGTGY